MNDLIDKQNTIKIIKDADVFVAYHEKDPMPFCKQKTGL